MQKSKLIRLLKVLDADEFKGFPKFINSPFFNSNKQFLPLYKYLTKHYPDFDSPKLTKELAFKKCYPNKKYSYNSMSNLMSGFATLTEEYLLNIQFQKTTFDKKKTLVKAISQRKDAYDLYEKYNTTLVQEVKSRTINDMAYHHDLRELNHDYYYHPTTNRQTIGRNMMQGIMDDLDISYAQTKLLYLLEIKSRAYLIGEKYSLILDEKAMLEKEVYFKEECPICLVYLKILKLYELGKDKAVFVEGKKLFSEQIETIGKTERTVILMHLLNYCIRALNQGDLSYIKESLELYKVGLSNDMLVEQNRMAEITFSNIVSFGVSCREFDWTEKFISNYQRFLDDHERLDATSYSLAFTAFNQKNYIAVINLLNGHIFEKPLHIFKAKSLLIRTYFELFLIDDSYYELLIAQTYAFEKYIRRHSTISVNRLDAYLNFIKFMRQMLFGIQENKNLSHLIPGLKSIDSISFRSWFLKKIKEREVEV